MYRVSAGTCLRARLTASVEATGSALCTRALAREGSVSRGRPLRLSHQADALTAFRPSNHTQSRWGPGHEGQRPGGWRTWALVSWGRPRLLVCRPGGFVPGWWRPWFSPLATSQSVTSVPGSQSPTSLPLQIALGPAQSPLPSHPSPQKYFLTLSPQSIPLPSLHLASGTFHAMGSCCSVLALCISSRAAALTSSSGHSPAPSLLHSDPAVLGCLSTGSPWTPRPSRG